MTPASPPPTTSPLPPRFDDADAYEIFMGAWSRLAGDRFIDWLAPAPGGEWADVGCGNGAFTALLCERVAPRRVVGIDPSSAQVNHARQRLASAPADLQVGDAQALPWADASVDAAVMALVLFFVPDAPRAVAELARITRPGGLVAAYGWDMDGGGFPHAALLAALEQIGFPAQALPSPEASRSDEMLRLWRAAGLVELRSTQIRIERSWPGFDAYWQTAARGPRVASAIKSLAPETLEVLRAEVRRRLAPAADGTLIVRAAANAVCGTRR